MSETYKHFLDTAQSLAVDASKIILSLYQTNLQTKEKSDKSVVTEADLAADSLIRKGLREAFPDHGILTEEEGIVNTSESEYVWIVDPLDGTKAYAKGIPGFCVMIGLLQSGQPFLGVMVDPLSGNIYTAIKGQGAHITSKDGQRTQLRVTERDALAEMPLILSRGFPPEKLAELKNKVPAPTLEPINSAGIKVGFVARAEADIYISHHPVSYWDTCAAEIILEEAGGRYTTIDGQPLTYDLQPPFSLGKLTLATNGKQHDAWVEVLKGIFG